VALGGPNIYPGVLTWLGVARELTAGTPLTPVITHPLEQGTFEPEDTPKFLKDNAIRGAMTDVFYETLGVFSGSFSFGGPNFLDSHGYFFDNLFGDLSTIGSTPTVPMTTAGVIPVGTTQFTYSSAPVGYTAGTILQIGAGLTAEVIIVTSTAASNVVNFTNNPMRFTHPTAQTVNTVAAPFTHRFAALNSQLGYGGAFGAQPPTHTFTDVTNIVNTYTNATFGTVPTSTFGARQYPFSCLKSMDFSGNAEQILGIKMSGDNFMSVIAGTAVTNTQTSSRPIPNWNTTINILGSAITNIGEFSYSFKRTTQVYWTIQGTQTPFVIARGPLNLDGTIQWDPAVNEQPLDMMLLNAQGTSGLPGMIITTSNTGIPNSGTPFTLVFQTTQVANIKSKPTRSKALFGYANTFEAIGNATDVGGSGGLGPGTITLTNATPTY
jgi:hypothetical protein